MKVPMSRSSPVAVSTILNEPMEGCCSGFSIAILERIRRLRLPEAVPG